MTVALPRSLAPWSTVLNVFPPELGLAIGRLVQRISAALDPIHSTAWDRQGEPDGINGLVNRGPYDRLLVSDWLLANEVPEEFDRRAAMNEHLFLNTARRNPSSGLGSIVLFDAGPDQIGTPRIVHLAIAIVLQRRAMQANASFAWGVLQDPEVNTRGFDTTAEVTRLLKARTPLNPSPAQIREWIEHAMERHEPAEIWLVGGSRLNSRDLDHRVSRILIEDLLEPGVRRIVMEVRLGTSRPRRLLLDLPENALCTRLLRDPFETRTVVAGNFGSHTPQSNVVWSQNGSRLLASAGEGFLLLASVPTRPQEFPATPKHQFMDQSGRLVGIHSLGKRTTGVLLESNSLRVVQVGRARTGHYDLDTEFIWPLESENLLFQCCVTTGASKQGMLLVLDAAGTVRCISRHGRGSRVTWEVRDVLAMTQRGQTAWYVRNIDGRSELVAVGEETYYLHDTPIRNAFFGFGADLKRSVPLLAFETEVGEWQINMESVPLCKVSAHTERVAGVVQQANYEPALVTVKDNTCLRLKGATWERTLVETGDPIIDVAVSPSAPVIAYVTQYRTVVAYSVSLNKELCRYVRGE
jgi:hypothetical protein